MAVVVLDCVSAPGCLSQVNPGIHSHWLPRSFSSLSSFSLFFLPAAGLDLAHDLDSPGPRFSRHVPLPERIGPITPEPQPDQSSLSPRERSSKKRFDEQPHPPHLSLSLSVLPPPPSLPRRRPAPMKDLNSRAMALRSPLGSPLNSPSLLLSSN